MSKSKSSYITALSEKKTPLFVVILYTGFLAGWLDIIAAFVNTYVSSHRIGPIFVLRFIASGMFGKDAFNGGKEMPVYGMLFHFLIAYSFTIVFFVIYPRIKIMAYNWIATGVIYGIIIWLIMNLAVLPQTRIPKGHFQPVQVALGMAILVVMIGFPLSYIAKRYYSDKY